MILPEERQLMMADNTRAFAVSPEIVFLPVPEEAKPFIVHPCATMGEAMEHAITRLDADLIGNSLGKLVSSLRGRVGADESMA